MAGVRATGQKLAITGIMVEAFRQDGTVAHAMDRLNILAKKPCKLFCTVLQHLLCDSVRSCCFSGVYCPLHVPHFVLPHPEDTAGVGWWMWCGHFFLFNAGEETVQFLWHFNSIQFIYIAPNHNKCHHSQCWVWVCSLWCIGPPATPASNCSCGDGPQFCFCLTTWPVWCLFLGLPACNV